MPCADHVDNAMQETTQRDEGAQMTSITRTLPRPNFLRPGRLAAFTLVVALAAGYALSAHAGPPAGGPMPMPMGMMMGPGHVDHMLDLVGATSDQRSQVKSIMDGARADLRAQHEAGRSLREQSMELFTQPTVDARTAEALRQKMLLQHDAASKRMMQAMLDVSRVLSVGQRQQLAQLAQQRQGMMGRHRMGDMAPAARPSGN